MSFLRRLLALFALGGPAVAPAADPVEDTPPPAPTWPAEPGPIPQGVALPLDLDQESVLVELPGEQRTLVEAWSSLHGETLSWGTGLWAFHLKEIEQDWLSGVRLLVTGGHLARGHSHMHRTISALRDGHLHEVSYRLPPAPPDPVRLPHVLSNPGPAQLVARPAEGEPLDLGRELAPVLLDRAHGEALESQVRSLLHLLLSLRSTGGGQVVDMPDTEEALRGVAVPGQAFSVSREGDRIEARGTFVASGPLMVEAGHLHLTVEPSGLLFLAHVLEARAFTAH